MKKTFKKLLALTILTVSTTALAQVTTMASAASAKGVHPVKCAFMKLEACVGHGDYAVVNEVGQQMSKCETGRAAIDSLHYLMQAGVCSQQD